MPPWFCCIFFISTPFTNCNTRITSYSACFCLSKFTILISINDHFTNIITTMFHAALQDVGQFCWGGEELPPLYGLRNIAGN